MLMLSPDVWLFMRSFFVSVATIIGLGILSLPVRMYTCGFTPFVVVFAVCGIMQACKTFLVTELLQRCHVIMRNAAHRRPGLSQDEDYDMDGFPTEVEPDVAPPPPHAENCPDFHAMGVLLLHPAPRIFYDACVFFNYTILIVAYGIGASEVYAALMGINYEHVIPYYVITFSLIVCIAGTRIQPFLVVLTLVKGTVLLIVIGMASVVGMKLLRTSSEAWGAMGDPFIISTLALGGTTALQPVLYNTLDGSPRQLRIFRNACLIALAVCWALNILWTFVLLKIVPQFIESDLPEMATLEGAYKHHQIGTIPLIYYLRERSHENVAIGVIVNIFISISVTVSFVVMSFGLNHALDGVARHILLLAENMNTKFTKHRHAFIAFRSLVYGVSYLFVFLMATVCSKRLYELLEAYSGAALNLQSGVFMAIMHLLTLRLLPSDPETFVGFSRKTSAGMAWAVLLFYGVAVAYGVYREVLLTVG